MKPATREHSALLCSALSALCTFSSWIHFDPLRLCFYWLVQLVPPKVLFPNQTWWPWQALKPPCFINTLPKFDSVHPIMTLSVTKTSEINSDKHVKRLQASPVNRGVIHGSTASFPILMSAMREYKYRSHIIVHHYTDDTMIKRKDISQNH